MPAKRRSSAWSGRTESPVAGSGRTTSGPALRSHGQCWLVATTVGCSRRSASRTVATGATIATRISHGSSTTRAAVCRRATMAATRGVLLGGVRYIGVVVMISDCSAADAA
jgi:hypothetical protein